MTKPAGPARAGRSAKMLALLKDMVSNLPTAQEKRVADEALGTLVKFLQDVQAQLALVPTAEDTTAVASALDRLDSFLARAESNPILARAIGIEKPRPRPPQSRPLPLDPVRVQAILKELSDLTIDQVRERLTAEDAYGLAELRSLAQQLGVTVQSRTSREVLARQIVTKLANTRGYQALSRTSIADT